MCVHVAERNKRKINSFERYSVYKLYLNQINFHWQVTVWIFIGKSQYEKIKKELVPTVPIYGHCVFKGTIALSPAIRGKNKVLSATYKVILQGL